MGEGPLEDRRVEGVKEKEKEREKTLAKEKLAIITRVIVHMIKPVVRI